jgi:hypothetical protein
MKLILGTVIFLLIMGCNREISESLPQSEIGIRQTVLDIGGGDVEKGLNHLIRLSQEKNATASLLIAQLMESIGDLETSFDYLISGLVSGSTRHFLSAWVPDLTGCD